MKRPSRQHHAYWQEHIAAWQRSGCTRAAYCRQHHLDYDQFGYYCRTLASNQALDVSNVDTPCESDFIPVQVLRSSASTSQFTLTHSDGNQLSWATDWHPSQVLEFVSGWRQSRD